MINTLVVGIDFGTTFSGASWAISSKPKEIKIMTSWDSKYHSCSDRGKCPTQLGSLDDDLDESEWGYNIPFQRKFVMRWFKLLLLDPEDLPKDAVNSKYLKEAIACLSNFGKSAEDAVADFLRLLWQHCMTAIYRDRGREEIDKYKIHIVITVPAIWPHYALVKMTRAAERAGMLQERGEGKAKGKPDLRFVSEPEAAALAVLADFHPKPNIKKDDTIVVCDAGGGTTDLISYQVSKPLKFELREAVSGEGELVGGVMVDDEFEDFISSKQGRQAWYNLDIGDRTKFMKESWEFCVKEQFTGGDSVFWIDVPDGYQIPGANGKRKRMMPVSIGKNELLPIFDGVVDKICALVQRQVDGIRKEGLLAPKFIILVGGFGCCRYLYNKLVEAHPGCTILNPPVRDSWTAVCRGAVRNGLNRLGTKKNNEVTVEERISRVGYGFHYRIPFNNKIHDPSDKIYEEFEEQYMADNQMDWFLKPGQFLPNKSISNHRYYELLPADNLPDLQEDLFCCNLSELPQRLTDDVRHLCNIKWDDSVDVSSLKKTYNTKGQAFYKVPYTIRVTIEGPNLHIDVLRGAKKVGEGNVYIDYK